MADIYVQLQKLANENSAKTFQFNKSEAAISRSWQKEMSDTSHQREVRDLIAAGLNPVLSSGGNGAQSYTTTSASGVADSAVNAIGNVASSRTSAAAVKYSADQSLKAAQAAAAAQRYAADRAYQAQMDKPATTIASFVDKHAGTIIDKFGKGAGNFVKDWILNPKSKVFQNGIVSNGKFTVDSKTIRNAPVASLVTPSGMRSMRQFLMSKGYEPSERNMRAVIMFMNGNSKALYDLSPLKSAKQSAKSLQRMNQLAYQNYAVHSGY